MVIIDKEPSGEERRVENNGGISLMAVRRKDSYEAHELTFLNDEGYLGEAELVLDDDTRTCIIEWFYIKPESRGQKLGGEWFSGLLKYIAETHPGLTRTQISTASIPMFKIIASTPVEPGYTRSFDKFKTESASPYDPPVGRAERAEEALAWLSTGDAVIRTTLEQIEPPELIEED
jgi:hypothetical protein